MPRRRARHRLRRGAVELGPGRQHEQILAVVVQLIAPALPEEHAAKRAATVGPPPRRCHNEAVAAPRGGRRHGRTAQPDLSGEIIKFLRMKPGHGEILLAEGDPAVEEDEERLIEEFRRQLDDGMWAAVPTTNSGSGRREAQLVKTYGDIPTGADRVIFFPRASGG